MQNQNHIIQAPMKKSEGFSGVSGTAVPNGTVYNFQQYKN